MNEKKQLSTEELNEIFVIACENQQKGEFDLARRGYVELLSWFSDAPVLHYNLGLVYFEMGNFQEATATFAKGVELAPEDVDLLFNLALSRRKCGDIAGAIDGYKKVLVQQPDSTDALYNLGGCFKDVKENQSAITVYQQVLSIDPDHGAAHNNIAYMYQLEGNIDKAVCHFRRVVEINPDHQAAAHMLAALTGEPVTSSPESYVVEVFENYSERYEESLVDELEYHVPAKIKAIVDGLDLWKNNFTRGLDLGCGTGLSGEPFSTIVSSLDGVDLSPKMVEIARQKKIYQTLVAGNMLQFVEGSKEMYDFFLAADVFAYLGDLEETFCVLKQHAAVDALFCFSTEHYGGEGFMLQETGRFAHSIKYVEELCGHSGWKIQHRESATLRKEKDSWIKGDLWFLAPVI